MTKSNRDDGFVILPVLASTTPPPGQVALHNRE
jgi:hypothetical protein